MKTSPLIKVLTFFILTLFLSSCSVISDIFEAGMGLGIFIVLLLIGLVVFIIARIGRR